MLTIGAASAAQAERSRVLLQDGQTRIDVIVDGKADGEGDAIVLLPSSQRGSDDLDAVAEQLAARGMRVLRPQPRGFGASRGEMKDLTLHVLAQDVAATIRQLGAGRAIVAGHAYGHYVARVADLDHPQLVRGVVMLASASANADATLPKALDVAADSAQPEALRLDALRRAFFATGNDPRPWLEGWQPELAALYRKAAKTPARSTWWPVSHAPVLDLQGEDDPWRPRASASEVKEVLKEKATVVVIPHASHALPVEQPKAVAKAIVDWAASIPR